MKKALLLLLIVPLAFAAPLTWETTAALAVAASTGLLAIAYMIGMGFGINELQLMAKEEFYQLIAMMVMIAVFFGANNLIDGFSTNPVFTAGAPTSACGTTLTAATTLQQAAINSLSASICGLKSAFDDIAKFDMKSSIAASEATQCTVMGVGYSMSACGGFSMLATPLSMAGGIAGFALGELSAMKKLIEISVAFALPVLLPLGIILRTFKLTRGAGGLLIALAISMHIMLPAGVIFNDMLGAQFTSPPQNVAGYTAPYAQSGFYQADQVKCDAADISGSEDAAVSAYNGMEGDVKKYMYAAMIQGTLGPVISLLMFAASVRVLTALGGAEIDVSAITRFI